MAESTGYSWNPNDFLFNKNKPISYGVPYQSSATPDINTTVAAANIAAPTVSSNFLSPTVMNWTPPPVQTGLTNFSQNSFTPMNTAAPSRMPGTEYLSGTGTPPPAYDAGIDWSGWADTKGKGGMALGALQVGLGAFNSWMGYKNQKFMQDYYGNQMNMQKADFANNAKMTNLNLEQRINQRNSNHGITRDSAEGQASRAEYMNKWGVKESF